MSLAALRQQLAVFLAPPRAGGAAIPTGIAALDRALSDGGVPYGRLTEIIGARGSGKTTLVRQIVAGAIAARRWVAYVDATRTLAPRDWTALTRRGEPESGSGERRRNICGSSGRRMPAGVPGARTSCCEAGRSAWWCSTVGPRSHGRLLFASRGWHAITTPRWWWWVTSEWTRLPAPEEEWEARCDYE